MKKKKKRYEQVVIQNEPLMPTVIGEINEKENSPIGVILLFGILIVMVFFLPNLTTFIEHLGDSNVTNPTTTPSSSPEAPGEADAPTEQVEYLNAWEVIDRTISGIRFQIQLDSSTKQMRATYTNVSGSNTFFITNKYYLELYSSEKQLLQRIKIASTELVSSLNAQYNIQSAYNLGEIAYVVIQKKNEKDYPAVTLNSIDSSNLPFLTCTKGNETFVYTFEEKNNIYQLKRIKENIQITKSDEATIQQYEIMTNSYGSIDGVEADMIPMTSGFRFETTIDLNRVSIKEKKRILDHLAYYEKNTEAKVVAFELGASGYTCS